MSYVIKAVLSNPRRPEYGQMTILFPIPDSKYDHTIELLEAMGSGAPTAQDCRVDELDSSYPILSRLLAQSVSVDELDYLAKRLDSFCEGEDSPFEAMAHKLDLSSIKDFINLTFCCQQATVITDFSNLERIGRDHRMNINGGSMPVEEYRALDGREEAVRLIESGGGTVTPYGVVYDNGMVLEQLYNGRQFPAYIYMPPVIALEVTPKQGLSEGQNPEYLCLPAASRQIERALLRAGSHGLSDAQVRLDFDELPEKAEEALDLGHLSGDDLPGLNRLCQAIAPLNDTGMEKLNAALLLVEPSGVSAVCRLAEHLEQFDFVPGIQTPEEYGRYMLRKSDRFDYDEKPEDFYDYRRYGEQRIRQEGGQFNACGYVAYRGAVPLEELLQDGSAQQCQQGPQMGGLA